MSAFVCIFRRDGHPVRRAELAPLADSLAHFGPRAATLCRGPFGVALRHRGAARLDGPAAGPAIRRVVAVAGRLHGRSGDPAPLPPADDDAWERLPDLLAPLFGSFALVIADPGGDRVRVVRDHLGSHGVWYTVDDRRLIAASDPAALLRHPGVSATPDRASIARFLAFRFDRGDDSHFRQIRTLPPAHVLRVTGDGVQVERYWRFPSRPRAADEPVDRAAGALRSRLETAVAAEVAGPGPRRVAVSLSGGLDSTAIAALAPRGVRAVSWYFDTLPEADERRRIEAVGRHLDLPVTWVRGDGLHPLCEGFVERFVDPGSPFVNPFAALKAALYGAAREAGCHRVLVGDGGDTLYGARDHWLRDLLWDRRPGALRSLAATLRRALAGDRAARRAARRALRRLLPGGNLRPRAPWLTAEARSLLGSPALSPILPAAGDGRRYERTVGLRNSGLESEERRLFALCGVERGNPFWTWPVLETVLHLPAHHLHRDGEDKLLSRRAFGDLLPSDVLEGRRVGLLGNLFLRGLEERRADLRRSVFQQPRSDWRRYVRSDWLEPYLDATTLAFGHTILWRVIGYELWHRRLEDQR